MENIRKNWIYVLFSVAIVLIVFYTIYDSIKENQQEKVEEVSFVQLDHSDLKIAVSSDLHLGSNSSGMINPLDDYSEIIIDALFDQIISQRVDLFILCGDITNSSREYQHKALVEKLQKVEKQGIEVIVVPGNHDIGFIQEKQFKDYYADFGYIQAIYQDQDSLSYAYQLNQTVFLMIDTNGYSDYTQVKVSSTTVQFIQEVCEYASKNHLNIIPVGHYPLVYNQSLNFENRNQILSIFDQYSIPLYLCGHQHGRNLTLNDHLLEMVVEQPISYPCTYAMFELDEDGNIQYTPQNIDVEKYAKENGMKQEALIHFNTYQEQAYQEWVNELVEMLCENHPLEKENKELAKECFELLFTKLNQGNIYFYKDEILHHPGYPYLLTVIEGTNYGPWIPTLLENATPYAKGFTIREDHIYQS